MKKKLLEKDAFYLSLFICICIIAIGGIWFTNKNVDNLLSKNTPAKTEDEIHLTENKKKDVVPTTTDSEQNLAKAKEEEYNKISYLGNQVIRSYSEKEPSYSETLEVWEIHKAIDVEANENQEIKSLTKGTVLDVYDDDQYGMSVKIQSEKDKDTILIYSLLNKLKNAFSESIVRSSPTILIVIISLSESLLSLILRLFLILIGIISL